MKKLLVSALAALAFTCGTANAQFNGLLNKAKAKVEKKAEETKLKVEEAKLKADEKVEETKLKAEEAKLKAEEKAEEAKLKAEEAKLKAEEKADETKLKAEEAKLKAEATKKSAENVVGEALESLNDTTALGGD